MIFQKKYSHENIFQFYFDMKMLKIFLLGIISGFPWVLIGSCLSLWLKEEGLSRSTIGWSGLIFAVYAVNYLWAPLVDRLKIPWLTMKIGHRKSWIFIMQILICICLIFWNMFDPNENLFLIILFGLIIALCSATQDITIDALRIEQINPENKQSMAAGASVAVIGWWTGFKFGGLISLLISDYFNNLGFKNYWGITFSFLILMIIIFNFLLLYLKENDFAPKEKEHKKLQNTLFKNFKYSSYFSTFFLWTSSTLIGPVVAFFKKNGLSIGIWLIAFIFLFKIGEAFLGRMSLIFYKEIGFSKSDIGLFSKGIGWITTVVFTLLGGIFTIKIGLLRAVFVSGILMALTNILFSFLYWDASVIDENGKNYILFSIAVILDDIAAAFATVSFVAFISLLVDRNYTATQYALLASIGTLGRTLLASSSGELVDFLNGDWGIFFIITALMVIPSLIILFVLSKNKSLLN